MMMAMMTATKMAYISAVLSGAACGGSGVGVGDAGAGPTDAAVAAEELP